MREWLLKAFCILWLAIITPAYGVLPLLVELDIGNDDSIDLPFFIHRLEGDLLRLAYSVFFGDPAPNSTHVSHFNMLTDAQTWGLVLFVFTIAGVALWYLYRVFRVRAA